MRAFAKYRGLLKETDELKQEIKTLDKKLNQAFQFLLEKIDALHQSNAKRKPIGFKIQKKKKLIKITKSSLFNRRKFRCSILLPEY